MVNRYAWIPAILLSLASCNLVKENRDSCPCLLTVELTGVPGCDAFLKVGDTVMRVERDTVAKLYVPRGPVVITAYSGAVPSGDTFFIKEGHDAPPLFLNHCTVQATEDRHHVIMALNKQFVNLRLSMTGPPGWGEPFMTRIRGSVCGISVSGKPVEGPFEVMPGSCPEVRLLRQYPDSPLFLDIIMSDSLLRSFSLSSAIQKASFDWTGPSLGDLELHLDLSVTALKISQSVPSSPDVLSVEI